MRYFGHFLMESHNYSVQNKFYKKFICTFWYYLNKYKIWLFKCARHRMIFVLWYFINKQIIYIFMLNLTLLISKLFKFQILIVLWYQNLELVSLLWYKGINLGWKAWIPFFFFSKSKSKMPGSADNHPKYRLSMHLVHAQYHTRIWNLRILSWVCYCNFSCRLYTSSRCVSCSLCASCRCVGPLYADMNHAYSYLNALLTLIHTTIHIPPTAASRHPSTSNKLQTQNCEHKITSILTHIYII